MPLTNYICIIILIILIIQRQWPPIVQPVHCVDVSLSFNATGSKAFMRGFPVAGASTPVVTAVLMPHFPLPRAMRK